MKLPFMYDPLPFSQPFVDFINKFIDSCFLPCSLSFRINSIDDARRAFDLGADRIVVNSSLWDNPSTIAEISNLYGAQSIVASLDIIKSESRYLAYNWFSRSLRQSLLPDILLHSPELFGEVKIQSVLRDGSVLGPDKSLCNMSCHISQSSQSLTQGAYYWKHYVDCLSMPEISCVSCTNVHHFSLDSITALKKFCLSHDLTLATTMIDNISAFNGDPSTPPIIHIGMHKTGTTSIQSVISSLLSLDIFDFSRIRISCNLLWIDFVLIHIFQVLF